MKKVDIIFAIICGLAVAWIAVDFFKGCGLLFLFGLPALSIIGLWLTYLIGKKILFVWQAGKYALAGAFAAVIDIKIFQFLFLFAPFSLFFKGISFLTATVVKFWINKHWTFEKHEKDGIKKEAIQFFIITLAGLALNVGIFYYFTKIMGAQFHMQEKTWTELSIILAAIGAAAWNFLGYKFLVFKR